MQQVFHFMPVERAVELSRDPTVLVQCACGPCRNMVNVFDGKVVEFHNGKNWDYRLFDSYGCALMEMPIEFLNRA